ncbi:MAG TPA: hypothetical protein VIU34_24495 [Steroidobacter sp.]
MKTRFWERIARSDLSVRHGHCKTNPAEGTKQAKERKRHGMPTRDVYEVVLSFTRERGAVQAHTKGNSPPYLWPLLEVKYLCRMRSIEVVRLTDAHGSDKGLYISRAKGSHDGRNARLSDLHAIIEERSGQHARGTVGWVIARFEESTEFAALSEDTRSDYLYCAKKARAYKTATGQGPTLDTLHVDRLSLPSIQGVIEAIAKGREESRPSAAMACQGIPPRRTRSVRLFERLVSVGRGRSMSCISLY